MTPSRARIDQADQDPADQLDWNALQAVRDSARFVDFHAAQAASPRADAWSRSMPRDRGRYGREGSHQVSNPAAAGRRSPLASRALQLGLIDTRLAYSINGLSVIRILAAMDKDRLTEQRAAEFTSLAAAIEYLLGLAIRASKPPAPT